MLARDHQKAPLMVIRPFTLPCGTLMVFIVNPTGGTLGGDTAEVKVSVGPGARALLLTQSAARLQPSPTGAEAVQTLRFEVAAGGRLEYYPERVLPFAGSRFAQTMCAELEPGAEFGLCETLATGRVMTGERLRFGRYRSQVEVRQGGRAVYLDRVDLQPAEQPLSAPGLLGGNDYSAAGVWVGSGVPDVFPAVPGGLASGLNAAGAVWLRATAARGPDLDRMLGQAREPLRAALFGAEPLQVRR
ncbi:urease accessory protein UreD [Deinococcus altitudinis]|uniref:urease accessory protein UreD n=1 Tax=Deinococcus altitudinis TaxID=468914 RepID=UPI0038912E28